MDNERWTLNDEQKFTSYNPESPSLQTGDEGNFKSKNEENLRPLGGIYGVYRHSSWFIVHSS